MIDAYINYFKNIAVTHPALLHQDAKGQKAFFQIDMEDLIENFAHGIQPNGYAMYVAEYFGNFFDRNRSKNTGALVILSPYNRNDASTTRTQILKRTEHILFDVVGKMQNDSLENPSTVFFGDQFELLENIRFSPFKYKTGDHMGHILEFNWIQHTNICNRGMTVPA